MTPPNTTPALGARSRCEGCQSGSRRGFLGRLSGALAAAALCHEWALGLGAPGVVEASATPTGPSTVSYPVPAADGVTIDKDQQVILVRWQQKVFAFPLSCPHENTALRWKQGDLRFQCPKHESKYRPDGVFISGRATRNMDRFAVSRNGSSVIVDLDKFYQSDTQAAEWAAALLTV